MFVCSDEMWAVNLFQLVQNFWSSVIVILFEGFEIDVASKTHRSSTLQTREASGAPGVIATQDFLRRAWHGCEFSMAESCSALTHDGKPLLHKIGCTLTEDNFRF